MFKPKIHMEIEVDDLCRLCLKEGGDQEHLFSVRNGLNIADLVKSIITQINISENDKLSKYVCLDCLQTIINAHELRQQSVESEKYLNEVLCDIEIVKDTKEEIEIFNESLPIPAQKLLIFKVIQPKTSLKRLKRLKQSDAVSCTICGLILSKKSLARHMKIIHDQRNFKMKDHDSSKFKVPRVMPTSSSDSRSIDSHKSTTSYCKCCQQRFSSSAELNLHKMTLHKQLYIQEHENNVHRPIGCSFCVERFRNTKLMKVHLQNIHDIDPQLLLYYCAHCTYSTNEKSLMEIHVKEEHFGLSGKPLTCSICDMTFMNQRNLRTHLMRKHNCSDSGTLVCDVCQFYTTRRSLLELHMKRVHLRTVSDFFCNSCDIVCQTSHEKTLHHLTHCEIVESLDLNGELLNCSICPSQFSDENYLMEHLASHENETDRQTTACILCSKVINSYDEIVEHTKSNHVDKFSHRCLECNKSFIYGIKFLIHIRNHREKKPLNHLCNECGRRFPTSTLLKKHTKIEHEKVFRCPYCVDVVYKTVTAFKQHVDGHTNSRKYRCPLCPKTFSIRNKFNSHYAFHLNDKMNSCPICCKSFENSTALKIHMQRHAGTLVKNHDCQFCDKKFRSKWARESHERTHTKEKPFKCEICTSSYTQKGDLTKHLKIHLGENVYLCSDCPESFRLLQDLKFHKMNNHPS